MSSWTVASAIPDARTGSMLASIPPALRIRALARPVTLPNGLTLQTSGSVGIASKTKSDMSPDEVFRQADWGAAKNEALARLRMQSVGVQESQSLGPVATGTVSGRDLVELARSGEVVWIERAPRMKLMDEIATKIVAGETFEAGGLAWVHELGYDGEGVTVSVADSGLDLGFADLMHPDLDGRVDALFAYDGLEDASDEHSHGTHCAGIVAGNGALGQKDEEGYLYGLGVAPGAHIVAQRIFDGQGGYRPPPSYEALTRDAVRAGAAVGSAWVEGSTAPVLLFMMRSSLRPSRLSWRGAGVDRNTFGSPGGPNDHEPLATPALNTF